MYDRVDVCSMSYYIPYRGRTGEHKVGWLDNPEKVVEDGVG